MGLEAIYQAPRTSNPHPAHRIYPYLLGNLAIVRSWCADITYIPVRRGFLYLVAIMDWATRHVLAWRLPNTMDAGFCVAALREAMSAHGRPQIFNTDQGGQFTSLDFTGVLKDAGTATKAASPRKDAKQSRHILQVAISAYMERSALHRIASWSVTRRSPSQEICLPLLPIFNSAVC
jgi:transposase InsO family protein